MASPNVILAIARAARPRFSSRAAAVVFAVHAALSAEGCELVAAGAAALAEGGEAPAGEGSLEGWDALGDEYAFLYTTASRRRLVVKALAAGGTLHVDAALADGAVVHAELRIAEFTSGSLEGGYAAAYSDLDGLVTLLRAKLLPCLGNLPAAAAPRSASAHEGAEPPPRHPEGVPDAEVRAEWRPAHFPRVGDTDLYPPGLPAMPPVVPFGGGGSLVGPAHPAFFPGGQPPSHPQRPGDLPPGARWDPYGPPGVPGFEPGRFGGERGEPRPPLRPPLHPDLAQMGGGDDDSLF